MEIKIKKWGNSLAIRIPFSIIQKLKLSVNDILDIKEEDNKIIIIKK